MKKLSILITALTVFMFNQSYAQSFDVGMLDKAVSLIESGNQKKSASVLKSAMSLLSKDAKTSKSDFGSKILSQAGNLSSLIPALSKGNANVSKVLNVINTVKMMLGADGISSLLKGGSLLGKGSQLMSNMNLLQSGLGLLKGGSELSKITKNLEKVTKKSGKLEKKGFFANIAQKGMSKKLGSSLSLLNGLI